MSSSDRTSEPIGLPPALEFLCRLQARLWESTGIGAAAHGRRGVAPVKDGWFAGPRLQGRVMPVAGADWWLVRPDGIGEVDVRAVLETDDGALIYVTYRGLITGDIGAHLRGELPREDFHFAVTPYFETAHPDYRWLQETVAIGIGYVIGSDGVGIDVYAVREQFRVE